MDIQLPLKILPAFLLYAVIVALLLKPGRSISQQHTALLISALLGVCWITNLFDWQALIALVITVACASLVLSSHRIVNYIAWASLFTGPLLLALHLIPGFSSETIFGPQTLGKSTIPYAFNINMDKALGALLILFCFRYWIRAPFKFEVNIKWITQASAAIFTLFLLAYLLGVGFDSKFGQLSLAFIFFNLFVTCVAEESFFRLLIHRFLFLRSGSAWAAILGSSILFTLAHFHTGPGAAERLTLIFGAGLIYAWVYQRTESLLASVLCHFAVNFIHLSLFVYPATF